MSKLRFRLQPLLDQRLKAKQEADEALATREKALRDEMETLSMLERKEIESRELLARTRRAVLVTSGEPISANELHNRSNRVLFLKERLGKDLDAVFAQKLAIEDAETRVVEARRRMIDAKREAEILEKYRARQERRLRAELERKEDLELDEIGTVVHLRNSRESGSHT